MNLGPRIIPNQTQMTVVTRAMILDPVSIFRDQNAIRTPARECYCRNPCFCCLPDRLFDSVKILQPTVVTPPCYRYYGVKAVSPPLLNISSECSLIHSYYFSSVLSSHFFGFCFLHQMWTLKPRTKSQLSRTSQRCTTSSQKYQMVLKASAPM